MSHQNTFTTSNHDSSSKKHTKHSATGNGFQTAPSSLTQTVTTSVHQNYSKLRTLVLKLRPNGRQLDLSLMDSEKLNTFIDELFGDLENTFIYNINDIRERIKTARPNPSDENYAIKMQLYQELLSTMIPIIQKIQLLAKHILSDLHALIDQLWDDIFKNNGKHVDRLLEEHAHRTEMNIQKTFLEPLDILEMKLKKINETQLNNNNNK